MREREDDFGHSLTDLMASVAVMFLLIAAIFMVRSLAQAKRSQEEAERNKARLDLAKAEDKTSRNAAANLAEELKQDTEINADIDYRPEVDPFLVTIVFNEQILHFDTGKAQPDAEGSRTIREVGPKILEKTCRLVTEGDRVQQITLEGHTDNQPFARGECESAERSPRCRKLSFEHNVQLSAARAQTVYFALRDALAHRPDLTQCLNARFVVSGRGPVEPKSGGDWEEKQDEEQKRRNRRVVIKVRMRSDVKSLSVAGTDR